ncbi:MAG: hypothetical protein ACJAUV_001634 [Flavobacteriales bacterium]|jgi:hypothetical protein
MAENQCSNDSANSPEGMSFYQQAFKEWKGNAVDLNNAFECFVSANAQNTILLPLAKQMVKHGFPLAYFENRTGMNSPLLKEIEGVYSDLHKQHLVSIDQRYRMKVEEVRTSDSLWNVRFHTDSILTADEIIKNQTKISYQMKNLITDYGFPPEDKIGLYFTKDFKLTTAPWYVAFIHSSEHILPIYPDSLQKWVDEGLLGQGEMNIIKRQASCYPNIEAYAQIF